MNLSTHKLRFVRRRYEEKFERWLVPKLVKWSTYYAKHKISETGSLRVLLDNSVLRHGLTHTNDWISTGTSLWGGKIPVETGYRARVPREYPESQRNIYEVEIPFFAGLAHLGETGHIRYFTSRQLEFQRFRQPSFDRFQFGMNLWSRVSVECLPTISGTTFTPSVMGAKWYTAEAQTERLLREADQEFLRITESTSTKHLLDFYHIWTAAKGACEIFLTTDEKLVRVTKSFSPIQEDAFGSVQVLRPSELAKQLKIMPLSHRILTPMHSDWFYVIR